MKRAKVLQQWITVIALIVLGFGIFTTTLAQTQRNPVLEFCTGTW